MIRYGAEQVQELRFVRPRATVEPRDGQWIDVEVRFGLEPGTDLPEEISDLTGLIICTAAGDIVQIVPQDEGRDCEFQFTEQEKEQLRSFYEREVRPFLPEAEKA